MNHPVLTAIAASHAAFDEIAGVDPMYMSTAEKKTAMLESARLRARAEALDLQLLAASAVDVPEETGARSAAIWLAQETRDAPATVRHRAVLARALDTRWRQTGDALAAGVVNLAQTRVMAEALEALPADLPDGILAKAEAYLVEKAAEFGPNGLRRLGDAVLEYLAPDIADEIERKRLEDEEARASDNMKVSFRCRGDGASDLHAIRMPDHLIGRLRAYLDAIANPHRPDHDSDFMNLPLARRRAIAFQWLLENILDTDLPTHGGTATSIVVLIEYDTLVSGLGTATTSTGDRLTAEQARRLACTARILPAVLGKKGEILDLGRDSRFFKAAQRKAMEIRDRHCTAIGCTVPARFCHAHHKKPWSQGGKTDLDDGTLLCPFHHGRAHDPRWSVNYHPNGTTSFTRRQ
jgi:hypothetical protein